MFFLSIIVIHGYQDNYVVVVVVVITAVVKDEEEEVVVVVVVVLVVVVLWLKIWKNVAFLEEVVACLYATFFYRGSNIPLRKCKARPWDVHSIPLEQVRSVFHIF